MTDLTGVLRPLPRVWARLDRVCLVMLALLAAVLLADPAGLTDVAGGAARALMGTLPFVVFAVMAVAYLKATGAESIVARAFTGHESRMIVLAAVMGGIAPFCSCEIIPFIAALLALGAPLSAVMALWLASPLMDPAMFAITAGTIGPGFALAKAVSAIAIGLAGGVAVMAARATPLFADPLRAPRKGGCCAAGTPFGGTPVWAFWREPARRATFGDTARGQAAFLVKWLGLAYVIEALMLRYVPADWIAGALGGDGVGTIVLGALIGAPAYLNGYAAPALVSGLLEQGLSPGAAMSFMIAGGVSCIPAAVAVWALVKPRVFAAYLGLGFAGAVAAGIVWAAIV